MTELGKLLWEAVEPETPPERLREIALGVDDVDILGAVARNPSAPVHVLEKLAQDEDSQVRMAVAENLSAPIPLLEKLAKDLSTTVRADLVWPAPHLPMRILEALGKDPEPYVRREVEARKKEKEVLFIVEESPEGGYVAEAVGHSVYTQAETFEELKEKVLDAIRLHFEGEGMPEAVRLSLVIPLRED